MYPGEVQILRIGDLQNEKLIIPSEYRHKIVSVEKYCTKPELEMLLIISENFVDSYEKIKSKKRPKFSQKRIYDVVIESMIILLHFMKNIMDCIVMN